MTERIPCTRCGAWILPGTAAKYAGLCAPCANGTREQMETGRRHHAADAARRRNPPPEDVLWRSLVHRVYDTPGGFAGLALGEQRYFVTVILSGEVFNGGFDQFFFNSSGDHFEETREALLHLGASQSLRLLDAAAKVFFGEESVPRDEAERRAHLIADPVSADGRSVVEALEDEFWKDPDQLDTLLDAFARESGLLPPKDPA